MFTDLTFSAEVTEGRLILTDEASYRRQIRQFQSGKVTVRVQVDREKRSTRQNRYYRLVLALISDHTGDEVDDLHETFKRRFLEPLEITALGETILVWTTTKLNRKDFMEYVERIRRFALMELEVETPDPDPALRGQSRHAHRPEAA